MTTAVRDKGAVIVTGASRGIGAAIAERLAGDGYGVIVNYSADADGAESMVSAIQGRHGDVRARPVERGRIGGHPVQQCLAWVHRDSDVSFDAGARRHMSLAAIAPSPAGCELHRQRRSG